MKNGISHRNLKGQLAAKTQQGTSDITRTQGQKGGNTSMVTKHSIVRAKERAGIKSLRRAETFLENALERGKTEDAFSSIERSYLQNLGKKDCTAIAYNGFCMIVSSNKTCVTMYELPTWFGHKKRYHGKERIRNAKKYQRYNGTN